MGLKLPVISCCPGFALRNLEERSDKKRNCIVFESDLLYRTIYVALRLYFSFKHFFLFICVWEWASLQCQLLLWELQILCRETNLTKVSKTGSHGSHKYDVMMKMPTKVREVVGV